MLLILTSSFLLTFLWAAGTCSNAAWQPTADDPNTEMNMQCLCSENNFTNLYSQYVYVSYDMEAGSGNKSNIIPRPVNWQGAWNNDCIVLYRLDTVATVNHADIRSNFVNVATCPTRYVKSAYSDAGGDIGATNCFSYHEQASRSDQRVYWWYDAFDEDVGSSTIRQYFTPVIKNIHKFDVNGLKTLEDKVLPSNLYSVIFVFTHYCGK
jgi:hypothetical protein